MSLYNLIPNDGSLWSIRAVDISGNYNQKLTLDASGNAIIQTGNIDRLTINSSGVLTCQGGMSYNNATDTLTAGTFSGSVSGTATTATNIAGGAGGQVLYQSASGTTSKLTNGTAGQFLTSAGTTLAPTWTTPSAGGGSLTANFNANKLGFNKKQRFILPAAKSITAANVVGKIDGTLGLPQLYTFGNHVPARLIYGGGTQVFGTTMKYSGSGTLNTWTGVPTPPFDVTCDAIFWTGTRWLAGGEGSVNTLAYSDDGITWVGLGKTIFTLKGRCFGMNNTGRILAGGQSTSGVGNTMAYSDNGGLTWTGLGFSTFYFWCNTIAFDGSTWVCGGQSGNQVPSVSNPLYYGYTGLETPMYTTTNGFGSGEVTEVIWNGSYWLAVGQALLQVAKASFTSWTTVSTPTTYVNKSICWNGEMYVMGAYTGVQTGGMYSYDGTNWVVFPTNSSINISTGLSSVIWDGRKFLGTSDAGVVISYNGVNWELGVATGVGACLGSNNFRRPNTMLVGTASPNAVVTVVGTTLTTSDLEIVESQWYNQGGYSNFSVRID